MEENIESLLTQDNLTLNYDECGSVLESGGKYCQNSELQCDNEGLSLEISDVQLLLDFATSHGIESQQGTGFVHRDNVLASGQIFEGDIGPQNGLVCLPSNLTNTEQELTLLHAQGQSGLNNQECFNQLNLQQQNDINNKSSEPNSLLDLIQSNEGNFYSVGIRQLESSEKHSKTKGAKKRKGTQVSC